MQETGEHEECVGEWLQEPQHDEGQGEAQAEGGSSQGRGVVIRRGTVTVGSSES
jgi:hypothetical protein